MKCFPILCRFRLTPKKDLFNVQIGQVTRVTLTYGPTGASKGIATIQFRNKGDAKKAYDRYDGKLIDNSRRLKVLCLHLSCIVLADLED